MLKELISEQNVLTFFLILIRSSGFVSTWPVFGQTPILLKIFFSLALSLVLFPLTDQNLSLTSLSSSQMMWIIGKELFIGLSIGFLGKFFFFSAQIAGSLVGLNMGISTVQLFHPDFDDRTSVMEQFHLILASLFFLAINGHHWLIEGLAKSFELVPLSQIFLNTKSFGAFGQITHEVLEIGIKISAPVMISILFVNIAMSIIGRAIPQINVLINSLSLNIATGFFILILTLPFILWQMEDVIELTTTRVFQVLRSY